MPKLSLQHVSKSFGRVRAVEDLSLEVPDGALVALLGPSGCGKTTALRLVAGFLEPDSGTISLDGRRLSSPGQLIAPEAREMAMIFQSFALWPHMTVAQNVAYGLKLRRVPRSEAERRTRAALSVVRLDQEADRYPEHLSGGQQQRVALARAMVVEPRTLLMDEPLSNLDPSLRDELRYEIRRLHDSFRTTTLYVTHDQTEAMTAADQLVVLRAGRLEQAGTPEEVYAVPRSAFVAEFLGGANILGGTAEGPNKIRIGRHVLLLPRDAAIVAGPLAIAVRHHRVAIVHEPALENCLPARVLRHTFLGSARDALFEIDGGQQVRALLDARIALTLNEAVTLHIPSDAIMPLPPALPEHASPCAS